MEEVRAADRHGRRADPSFRRGAAVGWPPPGMRRGEVLSPCAGEMWTFRRRLVRINQSVVAAQGGAIDTDAEDHGPVSGPWPSTPGTVPSQRPLRTKQTVLADGCAG